jgi:hypothetical protein
MLQRVLLILAARPAARALDRHQFQAISIKAFREQYEFG